jgi:hypothetical protein
VVVKSDYNHELTKETQTSPIDNNKSSLLKQKDFLSNNRNIFIKNCGQLDNEEVRFYAQDGSIWFTDSGVWFEIREDRVYGLKSVKKSKAANR